MHLRVIIVQRSSATSPEGKVGNNHLGAFVDPRARRETQAGELARCCRCQRFGDCPFARDGGGGSQIAGSLACSTGVGLGWLRVVSRLRLAGRVTGDSWLPGEDGNGRYLSGSGTGNFLTYTQDLGGSASCVDDSDFRDEAGFRCRGWGSADGGYDCNTWCVESCGAGALRNGYTLGNDLSPVREACPRACGLCTSDFTMTAQMKLFDLDGSAGTFMSE